MLSITRKVEYALIGLAHMASLAPGTVVTVRGVSEQYGIPGKLLAKVFHQMRGANLLRSHQGKNGGYSLARKPGEVSLIDVINTIEGKANLIHCSGSDGLPCPQASGCNIQNPMAALNDRLRGFLDSVTLETFCVSQVGSENV